MATSISTNLTTTLSWRRPRSNPPISANLHSSKCWKSAFTLIELLVVVAIITLLIAIILPSLGRARDRARAGVCLANMHGIAAAVNVYAADFDSHMPTFTGMFYIDVTVTPNVTYTQSWGYGYYSTGSAVVWDTQFGVLSPYFPHRGAVVCPSTPQEMKPSTNSPFNSGVGLTTPNPPVTVYQMAKWAKTPGSSTYITSPRITDFSRASSTAIFGETATLSTSAGNPAGLNGLMEAGGFSDASLVGASVNAALVPNLFAQHAKQGAVAWADGHATLETPWFCYSTSFEGSAARVAALQNYHIGWLSPTQQDPTTATKAILQADPVFDDYFVLGH